MIKVWKYEKRLYICTVKRFKRLSAGQDLFPFFMFPFSIIRSMLATPVSKTKSKLSIVFIARFEDGTEKFLRDVRATLTDLVRVDEIGSDNVKFISRDDCPLYRLDWSDVPVFADFRKHYPKQPTQC